MLTILRFVKLKNHSMNCSYYWIQAFRKKHMTGHNMVVYYDSPTNYMVRNHNVLWI
jgi:hypothetical protein